MDEGKFFSCITIENRKDNFCWEVINVYGPVKEINGEFLQELYQKIQRCQDPFVICGDFNMIRYSHEKSSRGAHNVWMDMFNSFIEDTALRDIKRVGGRFTWTNKQRNSVMSNLDRFFVSGEWEQKYPKVFVRTLIRVGSDHSPILLDDGMEFSQRSRVFRFESAWLASSEFKSQIIEKWPGRERKFRIIGRG
jgi:exonuclease III